MFEGTHTALVTPFRDDQIDEEAFRNLINFQIREGISGIVPVGTTGESPTLPHDEHNAAIRIAVEAAAGRCHVIAGTGSNSTIEAISLTQEAERLGASAALLVTPYYNKPSAEGLYRHYRAIAEAVTIPLILYSIPGRCGIEIEVDTAIRLATDCPNIRAIKEAGVGRARQRAPASSPGRIRNRLGRRFAHAALPFGRCRWRHQRRVEHHPSRSQSTRPSVA